MPKLKINFVAVPPTITSDVCYVVGVEKSNKEIKLSKSKFDSKQLKNLPLSNLGVSGESGSLTRLSGPEGSMLALVGLESNPTEDSLRELGGLISRELGKTNHIVVDLPLAKQTQLAAIVEGLELGNYEFLNYKPKAKPRKLTKVTLVAESGLTKKQLAEISVIAEAVHSCRNLVNHPANALYPQVMVTEAKKAAKGLAVKIKVWEEKDLIADRLGGIHAVGKGSARPPRLVKVEYKPTKAKTSLALVGKGITFDTGGLSLKPAESMVGMKYDMTGAAAVLEAVLAIARLALPIHATAWLCLAENMPSGGATRPNDVITIRNGMTVEVLNTDAEGRLVLADGLSMASEMGPDYLVDVATLTGAATIALGNRYAGLMGDQAAIEKIQSAAKATGELVWPMPLPGELRALLNSDIADIANVKIGNRAGGMLIGGLFLREFVGEKNGKKPAWAHLDIAGPANNDSSAYGHTPKGATGVMVRTLIQLARELSQ